MTRGQRVLAGLTVLLVLLYILVVAGQGRSGEGSAADRPRGLVGALADRLGAAAAVDPADLHATCLQPDGRLVVEGACALIVAPSERRMRVVRLRADDAISVSAPAPGTDYTVSSDLDAGEEVSVAVERAGTAVRLDCGLLRTCVVRLVREGEG